MYKTQGEKISAALVVEKARARLKNQPLPQTLGLNTQKNA